MKRWVRLKLTTDFIQTFCSFNLGKVETTVHEAAFCFEQFWFSFFFMQKNVYGASVIIFEGIMSFADKELLQVRHYVFLLLLLFEKFFGEVNHQDGVEDVV